MDTRKRPVSFIATDNPKATAAFYGDVLGLDHLETTPFALVFKDEDHVLRIQILSDFHPAPYTVYGWQVSDIATEIENLSALGIDFLWFEHLAQDATGIWTTPDGRKVAWFKDPSGNTLSITEHA